MLYHDERPFRTPNEDRKIWRYMNFSKFAFLLNLEELHFHRVDDFGDPFEGTVPQAYHEVRDLDTDDEELRKIYFKHMEDMGRRQRRYLFINCWHANENESAAMWSKYAPEGKGIAIKSTVGDLISAVSKIKRRIYISKVNYIDFDSGIDQLSKDDQRKLAELIDQGNGPNIYLPILMKERNLKMKTRYALLFGPKDIQKIMMILELI